MDGVCIHKQLADALPGDGWRVASIEQSQNVGRLTLTLQNGGESVQLVVEEDNLELGAYFTDNHARYYFTDAHKLEIDAGLHAAVLKISNSLDPCFKTADAQTPGSDLGVFDFYLTTALLVAALISLAPILIRERFKNPLRMLLKKAGINLLVLCCGTTLAFGFAEMLVRLSQINPAAPDNLAAENGRYHIIPQGENELHLPPDYYTVEYIDGEPFWYAKPQYRDQFGRRGSPPQLESGSELRVLAVGDSILFGSGVAEKDTFLRRAEALFRTQHPGAKAEFVNLSQPGWNFAQYKIALKRWIGEIKPRLVLVAFWRGDIKNVAVQDGYVVRADVLRTDNALISPKIPLRLDDQRLLADKSRFFALLFSVLAERSDPPQRISEEKKLHADFVELLKIVKSANAETVFLFLPQLDIPFAEQDRAPGHEVYNLLKSWIAREPDTEMLDPAAYLSTQDPAALRRDYCHFNETGHEAMSGYLADEMKKLLLTN